MKNYFKFILNRRFIVSAVILAAVGGGTYVLFFNKPKTEQILTVTKGDFIQQVSASGKIVARDTVDLSFEQAGSVKNVYVKVGDKVIKGQLLANQNTQELQAQVSEMQAGIDLQQARLNQLLAGNAPEDIKTSEDAVQSAQQTLADEYSAALVSAASAYTVLYNTYTTVSSIQNTYFSSSDQEGIKVQESKAAIQNEISAAKAALDAAQAGSDPGNINSALLQMVKSLNIAYQNVDTVRIQCDLGKYYLQVTDADKTSLDTQKTNLNASIKTITGEQSSIASDQLALSQAQDNLALKKAPARSSDIAVYQAQIKQAQAQEQGVVAQLEKKRIYSPLSGTVTLVNAKVGGVMASNDVAVSIIGSNDFQIESYIPEINISFIKVGDRAQMTLDAYGPDILFNATIASIDPAETIKDGVSTYKVVSELDGNDERIKSGMTGSIIITTLEKPGTISVPQGAVTGGPGKKMVRVKEGDKTVDRSVETGALSSSGYLEITSGLQEGEVVVTNP
jgi:multidrug efflux pump subunit AcrA (membrane-fusion protein)